ncbi:MAG TPA: hypothetical protein VE961_05555 [Pyrinomonadaceae bacterium]|nr:hypothetical protein [Pyrinomonadaceae bacterium]
MISLTENHVAPADLLSDISELRQQVHLVVNTAPVIDVHTHLFPPEFDSLFLQGIDDLLNYHYLVAEFFRTSNLSHARFWQMSKTERADRVWQSMFVENSPLSEAACGIISIFQAFDLDQRSPDLVEARAFFASRDLHEHFDQVLQMANVSDIVMTNDPFSEKESALWTSGLPQDPRFHASLRLDRLVNEWPASISTHALEGFHINPDLDESSLTQLRRFLADWIARIEPLYMGLSLPPEFSYPAADHRDRLLREVVLPVAREHDLPLSVMMGVRRGVNPLLRAAGDGLGRADITALERMCAEHPGVRFLTTVLSRENQHELCVTARKFSNLMPFGCWWFVNNPSIVSEITRERLEMLGPSFIPQHSDACVLEHLISKWSQSRRVIAGALCERYEQLLQAGYAVTTTEIERDVNRMFSGNFRDWVGMRPAKQ